MNPVVHFEMPYDNRARMTAMIAVDDVQESMRKVQTAGGKVLGEPMEIPGIGQYASFIDTEGNRVRVLQPAPRDGQAKGAAR